MKKISVDTYRQQIRSKPLHFFEREGESMALELFHEAAVRVPAYKDFLKKNRVNPGSIRSILDFSFLPETDKKNYIAAYPLAARCWDGRIRGSGVLAMSSGTSGAPTLWPRGREQEEEAAFIHEFLFNELFAIDSRRTLMIIGFPMGVYVSGVATSIPAIKVAESHPDLTVVTAGNNKDSVLNIMQSADDFEQIVLVGHPFFVKDVIESSRKIKAPVRALFCSEGFSEIWRAYLARLIHQKPEHSLFNTYGSSEFLLVGFENPHTIQIRKLMEKNGPAPGLFQYDPRMRYIGSRSGDLLITARSGVPLVRFNQHDAGEVISARDIESITSKITLDGWQRWNLPFVTLKNRSDRTLKFYAANIYPEHIQAALNMKKYISVLTGKFVLEKKYVGKMDQTLHVHIERRLGKGHEGLSKELEKVIVRTLEEVNMEYLFLRKNLDKNIVPRVILHEYQDPTYFKTGLKPRYIAP